MEAAHHFPVGEQGSPAFYRAALIRLRADERYRRHLDWGEPRSGHPEGTLRAHIAELASNARRLRPVLTEMDGCRLQLLIHAHDTFKPEAAEGARIADPHSHASLARRFLAEFCPDDTDLLHMAQFHDEPYALWRQEQHGKLARTRLDTLFTVIRAWDLFLAFLIVDGSTAGKSREPLRWFFGEVAGHGVPTRLTAADILE